MTTHQVIGRVVLATQLSNNSLRGVQRTRPHETPGHIRYRDTILQRNIAAEERLPLNSPVLRIFRPTHKMPEYTFHSEKRPIGCNDSLVFHHQIGQSDIGLSLFPESDRCNPRGGVVVTSYRRPGQNHIWFGTIP